MQHLDKITYVDKSDIHGNGLYARRPIKKGTIIGELRGNPTSIDGKYVLWLSSKDGFEVSCNLKFINHSDSPNACYYDDLTVVALRDIARNEEITHNYDTAEW